MKPQVASFEDLTGVRLTHGSDHTGFRTRRGREKGVCHMAVFFSF
jgi:hypothetical protein